MSSWGSLATLLNLHVHCLLGLFPFGTALLGLLVESLLGDCPCLVTLMHEVPGATADHEVSSREVANGDECF